MKNKYIMLLVFSLFVAQIGLHYLYFSHENIDLTLFAKTYIYLLIVFVITIFSVEILLKKHHHKLGFIFLGFVLVKMVISKLYTTISQISEHNESHQFLIAYLGFLAVISFYFGLKIHKTDKKQLKINQNIP